MIRSFVTVLCSGVCLVVLGTPARAARLVEVRSVDEETVMVSCHDAEVEWKDTGTGPTAFRGGCDSAGEIIHKFDPPLDTAAAGQTGNYELTSKTDKQYAAPVHPKAAHRKTKVSVSRTLSRRTKRSAIRYCAPWCWNPIGDWDATR